MYRTIAHRNARVCSRDSARGADSKRVCGHSSVDDAIVQVREAIQVHIEGLLTDGEPIPEERERPGRGIVPILTSASNYRHSEKLLDRASVIIVDQRTCPRPSSAA